VDSATPATISLAIANDYGRVPAGNVSLVVKRDGATVASAATAVAGNAASFTLPVLSAGTYDYALTYAGDAQLAGFTETGSLTVTQAPAVVEAPATVPSPPSSPVTPVAVKAKATGAVTKAPTTRKAGKYKVTITGTTVTGKVKIKLKKG